jgi:glutathione S-transferase
MIVWGRISSVNVQKVMFCVAELGLAHERREAGGAFGVVGTPEYRAMNPNGLVPTVEVDGLVLWESNAIVRYLCARHGAGSYWPDDPGQRALADRWADWQQTSLNPAMHAAFHGLVRTPPEKRDAAAIDASRDKTERLLAILDAHLAQNAWLGGERMTFAEFCLGPSVHRWLNMPVERQSRPHVERWYASWYARPGSAAAMPLPVV